MDWDEAAARGEDRAIPLVTLPWAGWLSRSKAAPLGFLHGNRADIRRAAVLAHATAMGRAVRLERNGQVRRERRWWETLAPPACGKRR